MRVRAAAVLMRTRVPFYIARRKICCASYMRACAHFNMLRCYAAIESGGVARRSAARYVLCCYARYARGKREALRAKMMMRVNDARGVRSVAP